MQKNQVSDRTHKQNILKNKVNSYRCHIDASDKRIKSRSSLHALVTSVRLRLNLQQYSQKRNKNFDIESKILKLSTNLTNSKNMNGSNSKGQINGQKKQKEQEQQNGENITKGLINPENNLIESILMKGLQSRAQHISNLAEHNTEILNQKNILQDDIKIFKQAIKRQKNCLAKSEQNRKKYQNQKDQKYYWYSQSNGKSKRMNKQISQNRHQIQKLGENYNNIINRINECQQNISKQQEICNILDEKVCKLKIQLIKQQKNRQIQKIELIQKQKNMISSSILLKQCQEKRANMLLEINRSVNLNKIS